MSIFEADDYKLILKALVEQKKKQEKGLLSKMAAYLGVNPSLVSQVLSGPKDFTEVQLILVCEFLGLGKLESQYLLTLVQISRAGSVKLKEIYLENLNQIRKQTQEVAKRIPEHRKLNDHEQAQFYSSWIYSMIQLFVSLEKPANFNSICEKFDLQKKEAQKIMSFLVEIGLVIEEKGIYKSGPINTHLDKTSPFVVSHLRNWRLKAMDKADKFTDEELMYSCSFSVSKKDFAKLREEFIQVIQKFLKAAQDSPAEELALFNIDLLKF